MAWIRIDKSNGATASVTQRYMIEHITDSYKDLSAAITVAKMNHVDLQNAFAIYRWKE